MLFFQLFSHGTIGCIFSHVRPFYERAVSDLGPQRSMHTPIQVAHSSFIQGSHMTKNTASDHILQIIKFEKSNFYVVPSFILTRVKLGHFKACPSFVNYSFIQTFWLDCLISTAIVWTQILCPSFQQEKKERKDFMIQEILGTRVVLTMFHFLHNL